MFCSNFCSVRLGNHVGLSWPGAGIVQLTTPYRIGDKCVLEKEMSSCVIVENCVYLASVFNQQSHPKPSTAVSIFKFSLPCLQDLPSDTFFNSQVIRFVFSQLLPYQNLVIMFPCPRVPLACICTVVHCRKALSRKTRTTQPTSLLFGLKYAIASLQKIFCLQCSAPVLRL